MTAYAKAVVAKTIVAGMLVRLACIRHLRDLEEQQARGLVWKPEQAQIGIDFFEQVLCLPDEAGEAVDGGDSDEPPAGKPFLLANWQRFLVGSLDGWWKTDGHRRFRTAYVETAKGSGKALALDTPIPTPAGWTTMSAIQPGDVVFDERGRAVPVIGVSDVMTGHPCYQVVFDDGSAIVADEEHLWFTEQRNFSKRGEKSATAGTPKTEWGRWREGIRTTRQIADTLRYANGKYQSANHSVPLAGPLGLPSADLPVDPYVLGVWLGDGDSDCARITVGDQDTELLEHVAAVGAVATAQAREDRTGRYGLSLPAAATCRRGHSQEPNSAGTHCLACERETDYARRHGLPVPPSSVVGLTERLRALGVINGKHVPAVYLRASLEQRLALLQGLMDTDGYISPKSGACEFCSTDQVLATGALELVVSLGIKCAMTESAARLYGREVSRRWRLAFHPPSDLPVFRLRRKLKHQVQRHARRRLSGDRRIIDVRTVASVPVRCIAVDTPSHLYLAGRSMVPTHNTPTAAGMGLKALVLDKGIGKQIFAAAVTEKQAGLTFTDAERMVAASPHLRELLETSVGNIAHVPSGSFIRRISSEKRGLDGKRVHMALIDEVHEHPTGMVVEKMRAGTKNRLDALIFLITNSGYDRTSVCWDLHEYGRQILEGTIENDAFFAYVCQLDPCDACYTKGVRIPSDACPDCDHWQEEGPHWLKANPNLGVSLSWSYLREQVQEAMGMPSKQNIVRRLNFCQWTEARSIWIPTDEWDACEVPVVSEGNPSKLACAVGIDLSTKQDLSACVIALRHDDVDAGGGEEITIETADESGAPVKRTLNLDFSVEFIPLFWMPEDTLRERQRIDRIPFDVWKRDGHLRTTKGPVVDYDEIYDTLVHDLVKRYRVQEIGYDKWNATQFGTNLRDRAKLTAVEVTQGKFLSETAKLFHALVRSKRARHGGNPVMNWCVANAQAEVDRFENIWLEKPSPRQRIDGVIAALIALHRLVSLPYRRPSVYKRRGALVWNPGTGFSPIGSDAANPA